MSKSATASRRESMGVILRESGANPAQISCISEANLGSATCSARSSRATKDVTFGPLCICEHTEPAELLTTAMFVTEVSRRKINHRSKNWRALIGRDCFEIW
jgi:hypothetical protein